MAKLRERQRSLRVQPMIAVRDVAASSRGYQELLGCESGHGGAEYERLVKNGELVLQLRAWGAHDHPNLGTRTRRPMFTAYCSR